MNNEYLAAQSDVKNPRELKLPGMVTAHTAATHDPSTESTPP